MCGIMGGVMNRASTDKGLSHLKRGKDGENVVSFKNGVTLGFQRHAVIAPTDTQSMQPVMSADGEVALVMNGEIFNYKKYRRQLIAKGQVFKSTGDAEVLLRLYTTDRSAFYDAVRKSMCAVGIVDFSDENEPKLVIARDWIGEMPLHYISNRTNKQFIFSSEMKGFLSLDDCGFDEIQTLSPGTMLEVNLNTFEHTETVYSWPATSNKDYTDLATIGHTLRKLLTEAARERIVADVPVCCLLSGGLDSTVTTYLIKEMLGGKGQNLILYCFHVAGHPIDENSDLYHARKVAEYFGLRKNLREVHVSEEEILETLPAVIYALEDKRSKDFNIYTAIYNYFLAQHITRDGFKVVFNGEGSDEFHGSYGSWGSFTADQKAITDPVFRKKMASNLHKGVLHRTSKVMMHAGPLEMRSLFLSEKVGTYILGIPAEFLRRGDVWKMPLVEAFKDVIPESILCRPKARPQDVTGIMALKPKIIDRYEQIGKTDQEIFENLFRQAFIKRKGCNTN